MDDRGQHFCAAFGSQTEPPRQIADRSYFTLATLTCSECPGSILHKPVFEDCEALGKHYILGHKAFALKDLYEKEFPSSPFPVPCPDQY